MTMIYLFPGKVHKELVWEKNYLNDFHQLVEQASDILGYSIIKLCLHDPEGCLNLTQYTQPALYVVNALSYFTQIEDNPAFYSAITLAGHSLGEYNALLAAEAFDFATGLKLVQKRGWLMSEAAARRNERCYWFVLGGDSASFSKTPH